MGHGGFRVGAGGKPKAKTISKRHLRPVGPDEVAEAPSSDAVTVVPEPPPHLEDPVQVEWTRIVSLLVEAGFLRQRDFDLVECLADAIVLRRKATNDLMVNGVTTPTSSGGLAKNPAATVLNETTGRIQSLCAELGMSPAARARVGAAAGARPANRFADV